MRDVVENRNSQIIRVEYWIDFGEPYNYPPYLSSVTNFMGETLTRWRGRGDVMQGDGISPTYYRAHRLDCMAHELEPSVTTSKWIRGWRYPPQVPVASRLWYRYRTVKTGRPYVSDVYTKHSISPSGLPVVPVSLRYRARTQALNKLADSKVNLGQSLGEAGETLRFVTGLISTGVKALRQIKSGNYAGAANTLGLQFDKKKMADNWLAYQFGLLPLLNDIYNGVEAIQKAQNKSDFITVSSVAEDEAPLIWTTTLRQVGSSQRGVQVGYTYKLNDAHKASLTTLGLTNPLSLAWELLPSSYIIDWFVSIGDVLSALGADRGYTYLGGYETAWVRGDFDILQPNSDYASPWQHTVSNFAMERTISPPPSPGLYLKTGLNFGKAITAVALLTKRG